MCKIVLWNFTKSQRFDSWILQPSLGKKGGRGQKTYLLGSLVELASGLRPDDG
jgi:hypothetical protein